MTPIRKLGCLLGLVLGLGALGAQAQNYEADPYYDRDDRYQDDDRYYDERDDFDRDNRYDDGRYARDGRRIIRCESRERRTNYCYVNTRGGVRLVKRLSDARCVRGDTWGVSERGIWVTKGCRADFELGDGGYGRLFRCESNDNRTRYCNADTRYGIRLVKQLSRSSCVEGRTWGISRNGVWVSQGCRAEFSDRYYRERRY